jgi:hypothetical protein
MHYYESVAGVRENLERRTAFTDEASASCSGTMTFTRDSDLSMKVLKKENVASPVQNYLLKYILLGFSVT